MKLKTFLSLTIKASSMKKRKKISLPEFIYNEPAREIPKHIYPESQPFDVYNSPGIGARITIEKGLRSFEGVNLLNIKEIGASPRDIVTYRQQIKNALYSIVKEGFNEELRLRGGAIAWLSALQFKEATELIGTIALNPSESHFVRGIGVESLKRLGGETALKFLEQSVFDPHPVVREKSVRALASIGNKSHLDLLKRIYDSDTDPEVRFQASSAMNKITTGKELKREPVSKNRKKLLATGEGDIVRPIGRHSTIRPQTIPGDKRGTVIPLSGGMNIVRNQEIAEQESEKQVFPLAYEIIQSPSADTIRIAVKGSSVADAIAFPGGKVYKNSDHEIIIDTAPGAKMPGDPLYDSSKCCDRKFQLPTWLPEAPPSPVIYNIETGGNIIWAKEPFDLRVSFYLPSRKPGLFQLLIKMPLSGWKTMNFTITAADIRAGFKIIKGFAAAIPGDIETKISIYDEQGGSSVMEKKFTALPSNPVFMSVVPSTRSTIGEGPAHYNSSEDRFYCHADLRVTNGFPHSIVVGPVVTARVTDGGDEKDNFAFFISTSTIPANSSRTIGVWMSFGGDTYDVFEDFGDVTISMTLLTTEGLVSGSAVWAAMAQIKLALIFVGNFSLTTRERLQSVVENESSNIYEQQNFFVSETRRFLIPSSHSDFNRYRDIRMDDNKDHDCTSGSDEADDMRDDWSSPTDWLDVWLVESLSGPACSASVGGFSPVDGPSGKGGDDSGVIIKMSSADLSTTGGRNLMGIIIAHEVGHFLGLNHAADPTNFMAASTGGSNTGITHNQYRDMAEHDFVKRFTV